MNQPRQLEGIVSFLNAKKLANGWIAKCPAHDDNRESLSINSGEHGLLLKCHAGCSFEQILAALPEHLRKSDRGLEVVEKPKARRKIETYYDYQDADGTLRFQVIRYIPKGFGARKPTSSGGWQYDRTGCPDLIYRLPAIRRAIDAGQPVIICEGEKDADNLAAFGLAATTNPSGATNWKLVHSRQLDGVKQILIVEDNDDAGSKRTDDLIKKLSHTGAAIKVLRFPELPEHSDVSDFLETVGFDKDKLVERLKSAVAVKATEMASEETLEEEATTGADDSLSECGAYVAFACSLFSGQKRELLKDQLMFKTKEGEWKPASKLLPIIRSAARERGKEFMPLSAFDDHLDYYRYSSLKPELLIDIPEWDGVDRIEEMGRIFRFKGFTGAQWADLMKQWGGQIFERLTNHTIQPVCPIIIGPQGAGKDTLIDALCGGLGIYFKALNISARDPEEAMLQLHSGLVFNISEFDRTARSEVAALKNIITTAYTDVRLKYDKDDEKRKVRASFIASVNIRDVLLDSTGARRFWLFEAEYLGFEIVQNESGKKRGTGKVLQDYAGHFVRENVQAERLQILAQFRSLGAQHYRASQENIAAMSDYVAAMVPDDPNELMIEDFKSELFEAAKELNPTAYRQTDRAPLFTVKQIETVLDRICKHYGKQRQQVLRHLSLAGLKHRMPGRGDRLYTYIALGENPPEDSQESWI